jgi:hypothetical protein
MADSTAPPKVKGPAKAARKKVASKGKVQGGPKSSKVTGKGTVLSELHKMNSDKGGTSLYDTFLQSGGSDSNIGSREIKVEIVDYFDYIGHPKDHTHLPPIDAQSVLSYFFNQKQELFGISGSWEGIEEQGNLLCRVGRVRCYVYPRSVNAGNASSSFAVLTSVPVRMLQDSPEVEGISCHQQETMVTPTFTPRWHKVVDVNLAALFGEGSVRPMGVNAYEIALFQMAIVETDNLLPLTGEAIQCKVEIDVYQTIAPSVLIKAEYKLGDSFGHMPSHAADSQSRMFTTIKGMTNNC